jgi:hypothetical protein
MGDPLLGSRVTFGVEAPHGVPQALRHMDQIDNNGDVDLALLQPDAGERTACGRCWTAPPAAGAA